MPSSLPLLAAWPLSVSWSGHTKNVLMKVFQKEWSFSSISPSKTEKLSLAAKVMSSSMSSCNLPSGVCRTVKGEIAAAEVCAVGVVVAAAAAAGCRGTLAAPSLPSSLSSSFSVSCLTSCTICLPEKFFLSPCLK